MWLSADATDVWRPSPSGQPGGQRKFSGDGAEPPVAGVQGFGPGGRVGVRPRIRYAVNRIDEDYFDGEDL